MLRLWMAGHEEREWDGPRDFSGGRFFTEPPLTSSSPEVFP